jgi:hypothetical protein
MLKFMGGAALAAMLAVAPTTNITSANPIQAQAATAAVPAKVTPAAVQFGINAPADPDVAPGQSAQDFRTWLAASPGNVARLTAFRDYLVSQGVGSVVPLWELTRTSSSWEQCGAEPFEAPPQDKWDHVVTTLKFVRDEVVPAVGPVEVVSGYRNAKLNACSDGAPHSAHREYYALDMVPVNAAVTRSDLVHSICPAHARDGRAYNAGLGFYSGRRFHVDSSRFRKWGANGKGATSPCSSARA